MSRRGLIGVFLRRAVVAVLLIAPVWGMAYWYVTHTPETYATDVFMILPGEGSKASVNLDRVGQATSSASSPWASSRLSPVEAYRKLFLTETVHRGASAIRGTLPEDFPRPKIKLIDQTNFITITINGTSPQDAQRNAQALIDAFHHELELLRANYAYEREEPNRAAIRAYQRTVEGAREAVVAFQARTGLTSENQFNERILSIERTAKRIRDVQTELESHESEVRTLEAALGVDAMDAAQALKLRADPIFQALLEEMATAKIAFERARVAYGDKHPEYLKVRRAYASITDAMVDRGRVITRNDEEGFRAIADLATHGQRELMLGRMVEQSAARDGLMAQLTSLRGQLVRAKEEVVRLTGPAAELDHLVREHQVALAVFASALAKADTSKADQFAAYPLAQVVEVPIANPEPVSPSRTIAILAAGAASFLLLAGLMMIWMRRRILRIVGAAFRHPASGTAPVVEAVPAPAPDPVPVARTEPPMPDARALDDEPLIEIPKQVGYAMSCSYSMDRGTLRRAAAKG